MSSHTLPLNSAVVDVLRAHGLFVRLLLTAAEVQALSDDDVGDLRELGLTDAMLADLRAQAQHAPADRAFRLDFERQTVTVAV